MALLDLGGLRLEVTRTGRRGAPALVLLHGFTGDSTEMLTASRELGSDRELIAIDLVGHGHSDSPADRSRFRFDGATSDLARILDRLELERADLWGYSLGARLALAFALENPSRVSRLILESASPGLRTEAEREARRAVDEELASFIEVEGIAAFVARWEALPLFASERALPAELRDAIRSTRLAQRPGGLAKSLRGLGLGAQPSFWHQLPELGARTLLLTGALDTKFGAIAREMKLQLRAARHLLISNAGHAPHRDRPFETSAAISEFLRSP